MLFLAPCVALLSLALPVAARDHSNSSHLSAQQILDKGIEALGGRSNLNGLKGVTTHAYLYRTESLQESTVPGLADAPVVIAGTQSISYDLSGKLGDIVQRLHRQYQLSSSWIFGRPFLEASDVTIVTRGGKDGYSCYVTGNEFIGLPADGVFGYTDPALANLFLRDATRLYPKLLLAFKPDPNTATLVVRDNTYPAVTDPDLNITIAFRPDTFLPYIIRSYEDHDIYGKSSNDFVVYNYTEVAGVQFPRRIKLVYNEDSLLLDTLIDTVDINPNFPSDFFQGLSASQIDETAFKNRPVPAAPSAEFGEAEVFESSTNLLWGGGFAGKLDNLNVTYPVPELPGLIHLQFIDSPVYTTTIANMEDAVMVTDAPPHQSKLVIQWVQENLKKNVTHLLLSHHHHDHAYGVIDFVAVGATVVVPQDYSYYWSKIPGIHITPVTANQPFIHRSEKMQVRVVWPGAKDIHSSDWMYFTFTPRCPKADSPLAVLIADAWSPGQIGYGFRQDEAMAYLGIARAARLPKEYLAIPIHGVPTSITELYALTAYDYPDYKVTDFLPGGPWC